MTTDSRSDTFTQLVHQHAGMVYSAARRQVHDPALADDVSQAVFLLLWRKLPTIRRHDLLAAWLLRATFFASDRAITMRSRRASHERKAATMRSESNPPTPDELWADVAPHLDAALQKLSAADREAVALHYLQNLTLADVGEHLGISEEAARKRIARALPKLHRLLAAPAAAPLGLALSAHAITPVPAALLSSLLATPTATIAATVTALAKSVSTSLAFAKAKLVATLACLVAVTGGVIIAATQLAIPPAVPAAAPVTFVTTAPATQPVTAEMALLIYSAGLEAPVADDIKAMSTVVYSKENYQLLLADAERVRQVLFREYLAGNVVLPEHASRWGLARTSGGSFTDANIVAWQTFGGTRAPWNITQSLRLAQVINQSSKPQATIDGQRRLHIDGGTCSVEITARDPQWSKAESRVSQTIVFDPTIGSGQVALVLHDLGQVGRNRRYSLIASCPVPASGPDAADLVKLTNGDTLLRLSPDEILALQRSAKLYQAAATQPAAPQSSPKWTKTLSDGTTVRLVAIGMPNRWPLLMWDPDGNPIRLAGRWPSAPPNITSPHFVCEVSSPFPTGADGNRVKLPDGTVRYVYESDSIYGGPSYSYTPAQLREFGVRSGVGPWQSAGEVAAGHVTSGPGIKLSVDKITRMAANADEFWCTFPDPTDKAIMFALVGDRDGNRSRSSSTSLAVQAAPGKQTVLSDRRRANWLAWVDAEGPLPKDAKCELLYRNVEVVTFSDFALQPKGRPPFDLQGGSSAPASPEPTRVATSRPSEVPQLRDDLEAVLAAAHAGEMETILRHATGKSERKRALFAHTLISIAQAVDAFAIRFQQDPTERLGEQMNQMASVPDDEYVLNADGSASSKSLHLVRSADGRWQVDTDQMFPFEEGELPAFEARATFMEHWTSQVTSGVFAKPDDALAALRSTGGVH